MEPVSSSIYTFFQRQLHISFHTRTSTHRSHLTLHKDKRRVLKMGKTRQNTSGHSTPTLTPPRPLHPTLSHPERTLSHRPSNSGSYSEPTLSARSSLLNVLTKPRHPAPLVSALSATTHSSDEGVTTPDDEFSDMSTISSYASSVVSSRTASSEELAKVYKDYLEKPFVNTKSTVKHSEFGHCNNPNWRWTSQVSFY